MSKQGVIGLPVSKLLYQRIIVILVAAQPIMQDAVDHTLIDDEEDEDIDDDIDEDEAEYCDDADEDDDDDLLPED